MDGPLQAGLCAGVQSCNHSTKLVLMSCAVDTFAYVIYECHSRVRLVTTAMWCKLRIQPACDVKAAHLFCVSVCSSCCTVLPVQPLLKSCRFRCPGFSCPGYRFRCPRYTTSIALTPCSGRVASATTSHDGQPLRPVPCVVSTARLSNSESPFPGVGGLMHLCRSTFNRHAELYSVTFTSETLTNSV